MAYRGYTEPQHVDCTTYQSIQHLTRVPCIHAASRGMEHTTNIRVLYTPERLPHIGVCTLETQTLKHLLPTLSRRRGIGKQ